jgi:hypothetical protein
VIGAAVLLHPSRGEAQTPGPGAAQTGVVPYRPPAIALVQPQDGGTVYQDRPIVIMRFAVGEASDPVDARSFTIDVDGTDRTKLFQVTSAEAWGPLASNVGNESTVTVGPHHINARICSSRGACAMAQAMVSIIPVATHTDAHTIGRSLHQKLLDAALSAARRILVP